MAAGPVSLKILGDWKKQVAVPVRDFLAVSMEIGGRTGEQACRHALILMAQSARALTKTARKNRKVQKDEHGSYVENWTRGKQDFQKLYKWMFEGSEQERVPGTWENARKVGNAGLAKRSWMWGLAKLKPMHTGKAIKGTSRVYSITQAKANGYIKENRLDYILDAMPAGWESMVQATAGNKIMAQARGKLEAKWRREMGMPRKQRSEPAQDQAFLAKYFLGKVA